MNSATTQSPVVQTIDLTAFRMPSPVESEADRLLARFHRNHGIRMVNDAINRVRSGFPGGASAAYYASIRELQPKALEYLISLGFEPDGEMEPVEWFAHVIGQCVAGSPVRFSAFRPGDMAVVSDSHYDLLWRGKTVRLSHHSQGGADGVPPHGPWVAYHDAGTATIPAGSFAIVAESDLTRVETEGEPRPTADESPRISVIMDAEWLGFTLGCNGQAVVGPATYGPEELAAFNRGHEAGRVAFEEAEIEAWLDQASAALPPIEAEPSFEELTEANGVEFARNYR